MPQIYPKDQTLSLVSVTIGMLMEDHADEAVTSLPKTQKERIARFRRLKRTGKDISALASAGEVLLITQSEQS